MTILDCSYIHSLDQTFFSAWKIGACVTLGYVDRKEAIFSRVE